MKHASATALHRLAPLIERLRSVPGLVERKPGTFYYRSNAFLHFHEDPAGLFADAKLDLKTFERHRVNTRAERAALVKSVAAALAGARHRVPPR
ncbi:MAG TPA: hypothetical protein VLW55_18915 [Burkholderiaceae bacterium]|nr:hypothetical protein [Burkholderiaceae bacterium]